MVLATKTQSLRTGNGHSRAARKAPHPGSHNPQKEQQSSGNPFGRSASKPEVINAFSAFPRRYLIFPNFLAREGGSSASCMKQAPLAALKTRAAAGVENREN
jgi:hypothetical protein